MGKCSTGLDADRARPSQAHQLSISNLQHRAVHPTPAYMLMKQTTDRIGSVGYWTRGYDMGLLGHFELDKFQSAQYAGLV